MGKGWPRHLEVTELSVQKMAILRENITLSENANRVIWKPRCKKFRVGTNYIILLLCEDQYIKKALNLTRAIDRLRKRNIHTLYDRKPRCRSTVL